MKNVEGFVKELKIDENPWWSPTRTKKAEKCMKEYWFEYILHLEHQVPSSAVIGKHNHIMIQNFWKEEPYTKKLVPGYKSYESYINSSMRDWKFYYAKTGEIDGKKIEWRDYDGNGWGKGLIGRIAETAGIVYTRYMNEEPRLKAEFEMRGEFDGIKIMARVDELRENLVIRDHKSGNEKIREYFLRNNVQMTLCAMCLFECLQNPYSIASKIYPKYRSISLDEFLDILMIEIHDISPKWPTKEGIHKPITKIYNAKRTEQDFHDVIQIIESKQKALKERDFHPSKENCDFCFYRDDCNNYSPTEYHKNEYKKNFPLFADAGLFFDNYKPKIAKKRLQRIMRFK